MKLPPRYVPTGKKFTDGSSEPIVCKDTNLDREVVIKSLDPSVDQKRILDELAALQTIRSKHVVEIYDVIRDEKGGILAIVEEYLPGNNLMAIKTPQTADEFLRLLYPIAQGVADIHAHNRIHRDIKRTNMKYDAEGCLKIFDFGLSKDASVETSTIGVWGTKGFMAPELFLTTTSGKVDFTKAVDIYAFGAVALALAKLNLPKQLTEMPPVLPCAEADFALLPQSLPGDVAAILNQCLDAKPATRPTMIEVSHLIESHLLRGQHRALLVSKGVGYYLDDENKVVELAADGLGSLTITYDGMRFTISKVAGYVAINNAKVKNGDVLPGSCVIVIGPPEKGMARRMITVDVSHPEVET